MPTDTIFKFLHFNRPTKEQEIVLKAMEEFVSDENAFDFLVLCGAAGTGKTSITAALIGYLNSLDRPYKIAAPTGRAARILGKKTKAYSSTIHSLIYSTGTNKESGEVYFTLKQNTNSNSFSSSF